MKIITENQDEKMPKVARIIFKIVIVIFILIIALSIFCWWYTMRGKIDKNISNEDLESINSTFYTNFQDSSNIVETFNQWHMQGGTSHDIYIKDVGNYQEFLDNYTNLSNEKIITDKNTIKNNVQIFLQFYFRYSKNFDVKNFSPDTIVTTKIGEYNNGTDKDIRLYFFTEDDNSQSVIIDVI